ncbi:MAG: hypothetical protein HeimC2_05320 [Candidatus Heimdallarchaeota archaeon LC_2]|nr:MAG: hypothetical protein HeimC2_05320 [Candidatus Heimdallarchaeota archaeon LC_2]
MGAFGSTIGGIMVLSSFGLSTLVVWELTDNMFMMYLFFIFGVFGGIALGALNGRKARSQPKYKNEYTSYAGMFFTAILALAGYYAFFAIDTIESSVAAGNDYEPEAVLFLAVISGLLAFLGFGLTIANSLAEERY